MWLPVELTGILVLCIKKARDAGFFVDATWLTRQQGSH